MVYRVWGGECSSNPRSRLCEPPDTIRNSNTCKQIFEHHFAHLKLFRGLRCTNAGQIIKITTTPIYATRQFIFTKTGLDISTFTIFDFKFKLKLYNLSRVVDAISRRIDTESDVTDHAVLDVDAVSSDDADDGVVATLRVAGEDAVDVVGGAVDLSVLGVRVERHDLRGQRLVEVDLASRGNVTGADGTVAVQGPVRVGLDVDVDGALDVEAGEDGLHLHDALGVGGPLAAQPGGVVGVEVGGANLKVGNVELVQQLGESRVGGQTREARVTSSGVAMPKVEQDVGQRLAGVDVEHAHVQPEGDTLLVLAHILPQRLGARPDVRSLGDNGAKNAGVVLDGVVVGSLGGDLVGDVTSSRPSLGHAALVALLVEACGGGLASPGNGSPALDFTSGQMLGVGQSCRKQPGGEEGGKLHGEDLEASGGVG